MKVILLENIKGLGRIGDIKNVSDGYGKNFLLPKNLAKLATSGSLKNTEGLKAKLEESLKIETEKANEAALKLKDTTVVFTKKTSKTGKLFSSITKEDVAKELTKKTGFHIDKNMILFEDRAEHIKQSGEHAVTVELAPDNKVEIKIAINPEEK